MSPCKHPVTHTDPDGKTECLVCGEVTWTNCLGLVDLERAYAHSKLYGSDSLTPVAFTGLTGRLEVENG